MIRVAFLLALGMGMSAPSQAELRDAPTGAFVSTLEVTVPGSPEAVFDALTGDISGWWDHTFSESPAKLFIEPKPGGGFWEIFDAQGNGVRHAVVTAADRGRLLRMEGPLGLAGNALLLVTTITLAPVEGGTLLKVSCHGSGELDPAWPQAVDGVWRHFIEGRFVPYMTEREGRR